jgi:hypothetical protein
MSEYSSDHTGFGGCGCDVCCPEPGPPVANNERTMQDDLDRLREAWLDLTYGVMKALGIVALVRRLGMQPKAWVREREARDG